MTQIFPSFIPERHGNNFDTDPTAFAKKAKSRSAVQGGSDKSGLFFFLLSNDTAQLKIIRFD
jgi:hypothetical protein